MKKMIAILMLVTLILLAGCGGKETANDPVPKDFRGLVLIAPAGTTVFLHTEFEGGQVVPVDQVYETEEYDYYCYADQSGAFRCECSANGYYQVTQNIYITPEEAQGRTDCYILNSKRSGQGWEPREVTIHTEEFRGSAITGDAALWQDYMPALQSPYFTGEHAAHQTTTQEEMLQFIRDRDDSDDDMYVYNTGYSAVNQQEIPIVVFTRADLSGATTLEEAAALMGQEKPLVILGAIGSQMRWLRCAKMLSANGKGKESLMALCGIKEYPARKAMSAAAHISMEFCDKAVVLCTETDYRMKTSYDDPVRLLELLILRLSQEAHNA